MPFYLAAVFLSAFLVFQVQPIIARMILPWYGGSPAVWTTCMLFFQAGLLGGYALAHLLVSRFRRRPAWQAGIQLALLALACLLLPILPPESLKPTGEEPSPTLGIITLLAVTILLPYLTLSASGPLLQHWFTRSHPRLSPYRLYSVSNVGSLLGLLTYPFLVEPVFRLQTQAGIWSILFVGYVVLAGLCAIGFVRAGRGEGEGSVAREEADDAPPAPPLIHRLLWVVFAASGSILLIAITNQMCQDVAVVPFLWILPLSLYLTTFIICFDHARWYFRPVWIPLAALSIGALVYLLNQQFAEGEIHLAIQIGIYAAALLTACMMCHGEMVRIKPHPHYLTSFYLAVSLGGALGGLFVNLAAPRLFSDGYWELPLVLLAVAVLTGYRLFRDSPGPFLKATSAALSIAGITVLACFLHVHYSDTRAGAVDARRGFYGVLRIYEGNEFTEDHYRSLYHGRISHGRQYLSDQYRELATTYYGEESGVGAAFASHPTRTASDRHRPFTVGVVGLGIGTIATHMQEGEKLVFYEINPQVTDLAREQFTYLEDCRADTEVVLGDGRISLDRERTNGTNRQFDILFVDAFSGDSIPIHLLTREAFALYFDHMAPGGVLAIHISNLHLDLSDPVRRLASEFDKEAALVMHNPEEDIYHLYYSEWVLVSDDEEFLTRLREAGWASDWYREEPRQTLWTDDYSNLLEVIMWEW